VSTFELGATTESRSTWTPTNASSADEIGVTRMSALEVYRFGARRTSTAATATHTAATTATTTHRARRAVR
jgi:hypothetical protein